MLHSYCIFVLKWIQCWKC